MQDKISISGISERSNINLKEIKNSKSSTNVVIYEDHRTILNVLFHASKSVTEPLLLDIIMFDYHDDFLTPNKATLLKIEEFLKNPNKEDLLKIVEFDLRNMDDDWVKAGMELGLIGNVFLFNVEDDSNVRNDKTEYTTRQYGTHYVYKMGNVWDVICGKFNDIATREQYKSLFDDFGWEFKDGRFNFKEVRKKFILDIDLDCFSTKIFDKRIVIPDEVIFHTLVKENENINKHYYNSPQKFIHQLIIDSEFVTLCFENECCGGFRNAFKIFNLVDGLFFEYKLGE